MDKEAKIYIAGHTGLVGSAFLRKLGEKGFTGIIARPPEELDLRRQQDTEAFFAAEKPEYVFLAAAKVGGILANSTYKAEFIYDNMMIAANVIHAAYLHGVKKLLNLGTSCIYPRLAPQPMKEESLLSGPLEPTNESYAIAKISAIKLSRYYNEQFGTDFISVMPTNLYGPGDNFNLEIAHVLPALLRKFHLAKLLQEGGGEAIEKDLAGYSVGFGLDGKKKGADTDRLLEGLGVRKDSVTIWGSGEARREFLYVDDLAEACIFLMERCSHKDIGEFINIGSGEDIKIKDLAALVKDIVGFKGAIRYDRSRPDGTPQKLLDVSRIKRLGWSPGIGLEEGIKRAYEWYLRRQAAKST